MKRLAVFSLVAASLLVCQLLLAQPAERFSKTDELSIDSNGDTLLFIPTFVGEAFLPSKLTISTETAAMVLSITIYTPSNRGPLAATDSFTITKSCRYAQLDYYGPLSDTMRVECDDAVDITVYK